MKFEVINQFGITAMWCDEFSCIPSPEELKSISSAGYRFKVDGKIIALNKLLESIGAGNSAKSVTDMTAKKTHKWF